MSKQLVLVTGGNGFLGSHIIDALLEAGYAVRGTVRSSMFDEMKKAPISAKYPDFSVVTIDDVGTGDFTEALDGVHAIIHVASPIGRGGTPEELIALSKNGMLNVLRQGLTAGITKVVVTSTYGVLMTPDEIMTKTCAGYTFTEQDRGVITEEDFAKNVGVNPIWAYVGTKILAEQELWAFAKEHPALDLATIYAPFFYGPLQTDFPIPSPSKLTSNEHIYSLVYGEAGRPVGFQLAPQFIDIRDCATAHVRALSATGSDKRYLVSGGHILRKTAVEHLAKTRPELKKRLPSLVGAPDVDVSMISVLDTTKAKKELGIDKYIPWEQTLDDTVTSLLAQEAFWSRRA